MQEALPEKEEDAKRVVRQATGYYIQDGELYRKQYAVACRATRSSSSSFSGSAPCLRYSLNSLVQRPSWGPST